LPGVPTRNGTLHKQKKHAEAEPVLLAAYKEMTERVQVMPTWDKEMLSVTATALVESYTVLGKSDEASNGERNRTVSARAKQPEKKMTGLLHSNSR
jgi:hypothetical protein